MVEQPLPAGDAGAEELRAASPIPIYVDEDCHTLADVARCAEIAHGINIKLANPAGSARRSGWRTRRARSISASMLGCMVESGIGIAAGCVVAPLCDHVDLDGNLLLVEDPCPGVAFIDGVQLPSDVAGSRCRLTSSRRLLILAEGFSGDPHYGKTMRGVLRYRREDVVAILDSMRAGENEEGVPIVADVAAALPLAPTAALVGVATQGGRFPPAWREILRDCITNGIGIENGLHPSSSATIRSSHSSRASRA